MITQALRAVVRTVMERPHNYVWSVQGFGMMRTYFGGGKQWRLNVWDSALAVPNVSIIHDHPWDFESHFICGRGRNIRYHESQFNPLESAGTDPYSWMRIKTGEGGGPDGDKGVMNLMRFPVEYYHAGDVYRQRAEEIHSTHFNDGTITINDRSPREDGEHARVWWPYGDEWVDAEPREACEDEVNKTAAKALAVMRDEDSIFS